MTRTDSITQTGNVIRAFPNRAYVPAERTQLRELREVPANVVRICEARRAKPQRESLATQEGVGFVLWLATAETLSPKRREKLRRALLARIMTETDAAKLDNLRAALSVAGGGGA